MIHPSVQAGAAEATLTSKRAACYSPTMKAPAEALGSTEPRSTRDGILDSAERLFAERGFDGVSVREIAADSGLKNQASLYHHFQGKRAIYEAVLARGLEPIIGLVVASATDDDGPGFVTFLDRVVDHLVEHPHLPRLIQRAALDDSEYLRDAVGRVMRPLYSEGVAVLARADGPWGAEDYFHLGASLYQMIFGYFANAQLFGAVAQSDPLAPAAVERQRRFLRTAVARLLNGDGEMQRTPLMRTPNKGANE